MSRRSTHQRPTPSFKVSVADSMDEHQQSKHMSSVIIIFRNNRNSPKGTKAWNCRCMLLDTSENQCTEVTCIKGNIRILQSSSGCEFGHV